MEIEELDRILTQQLYPMKANECLKHIAKKVGMVGLSYVLKEAYCLGVIDGKRSERLKNKKI